MAMKNVVSALTRDSDDMIDMISSQEDFNRSLEKITYWQDLIEKEEEKISNYFDRHPEALATELE